MDEIIDYLLEEFNKLRNPKQDKHIYLKWDEYAYADTIMGDKVHKFNIEFAQNLLRNRLRYLLEEDGKLFIYICPDNQLFAIENHLFLNKGKTLKKSQQYTMGFMDNPYPKIHIAWD